MLAVVILLTAAHGSGAMAFSASAPHAAAEASARGGETRHGGVHQTGSSHHASLEDHSHPLGVTAHGTVPTALDDHRLGWRDGSDRLSGLSITSIDRPPRSDRFC